MVESIVLAEDSLEYCFFFKKALKQVDPQKGFVSVNDGDKLIRLLESYLPDLLFLDLAMPCKNGVQCIKEIREQREYSSMPIIVFSVTDDDKAIQVAYALGANLYIVKPNEYTQLVQMLKTVLSMDWSNPKSITKQQFQNNKYLPLTME